MTTEQAWQRSRDVRMERARIRAYLADGGSLTFVLAENREALDGVELDKLVRWIRHVGAAKARRILLGLPAGCKLGSLNSDQYWSFVRRVREVERSIIQRQIRQGE